VNIVQSALSTSIRQLEAELDAPLFVRNTRQVSLTAAGKVFLGKARVALAAIADARDAVAAVQGLRRGTLSIGTMQSLPPFLDLPAIIERFHTQYPDIEVRLSQGASSDLLALVRSGRLDLAFVPVAEPLDDIAATMIACDALVVACAPEHPLAGRRNVPLDQLKGYPFVDFDVEWGTRKLIDRGFRDVGIERHTAFEVSDLETLAELVRRGLGIALLPESVARSRLPALGIAELAEPELCWELVVAYTVAPSEPLPTDQAPRAFLELLNEVRPV
jgi:DNA-binding transcriptional LysR family regulator